MKKFAKILALTAMALALCLSVFAIVACGDSETTYVGEYHYANAWGGADYGVKVNVTVKGETITKVEIVDSTYTVVSDGWTDKATWNDGVAALLAKYEGKTVKEVNAITVTTNPETVGSADTYFSAVKGQPDNGQKFDGLVITGATQGSGRLLLAVQDALSKIGK